MSEDVNAFLGRGFKFPVQVDEITGKMKTSAYEEDIKEAIYLILMTKKGERIMKPEFGCGVHDYVFGTMDYTSLSMMERAIRESLTLWEPRITDLNVDLMVDEEKEGCILVNIDYRVRSTNNPYNLVFPFYMNEGFGENA
jgi:hypothetical protein